MHRLVALLICLLLLPVAVTAQGIITTVAGTGTSGFSPPGDGVQATTARLTNPFGVAFDAGGNLFIADRGNHRVRRVDAATGIITTVAGTGISGFLGDGGPATTAQLNLAHGIAFDAGGNLYIDDIGNTRVRKVVPGSDGIINGGSDEIITTVAGTGTICASPLLPCGDGGPATSASFNFINGMAFDAGGNLFIADDGDRRVRKVVPGSDGIINGGSDEIITTVAGTGFDCLVSTDPCGDGGPATSALLESPRRIVFDAFGNLFIPDPATRRVRKVVPGSDGEINGGSDEIITTAVGSGFGCSFPDSCGDGGPASSASLGFFGGIAFDAGGNLYVADRQNHRIREVAPGADGEISGASDEVISNVAGNEFGGCSLTTDPCGDGGIATSARLRFPEGIALDPNGRLHIADTGDHRIRKVTNAAPDTTAPEITPSVVCALGGNAPWCRGDITVSWTVNDSESAVSFSAGCDPVVINSDTPFGATLSCSATSDGGSASESVTVYRDTTQPTVTCQSPPIFLLHAEGSMLSATVTDAVSGPVSTSIFAGTNTSSVGSKSAALTGFDVAGNNRTELCSYSVQYAFMGFFSPVDNPPIFNVGKAGQAYAIKWQIRDSAAAFVRDLSTVSSITFLQVPCAAGTLDSPLTGDAETSGSSGMHYDLVGEQFIFNWKTARNFAGLCLQLNVNLNDGGQRAALFKFIR